MGFAKQLQEALAALAARGSVEVLEDGRALPGLAPFEFEVRGQGQRVMLHLWSSERNLARRVLRIAESTDGALSLEVQRFGRNRPGKLEFIAAAQPRAETRLTRARFRARFEQILAEQFPDEQAEGFTTAADLEHSFSGSYVRGRLRRGQQVWAVMAASPEESAATLDAMMSYALLWLDWNRRHPQRGTVAGLRLFLPPGGGRLTAHRLRALDPAVHIELFETDLAARRLRRVDPHDTGNLDTWLTPRREIEATLAAAEPAISQVRGLAPDAVTCVVPGAGEVSFRFRGLEFARWKEGQLEFGLGNRRRQQTSRDAAQLGKLVNKLRKYRTADAAANHHPLFRVQGERWLESVVLANPASLDARLEPGEVYTQVPALSAADRGVIDLLGRTRDARLVVIELKAQEDLNLVLQAVDYWLRVRWHQEQGDFHRYGYFLGGELQSRPPLLWLVAPGLRFHPATGVILSYLSPQIEVTRIGLNETWRSSLQVIFRH